jgi:hypothetical protein
MGKYATVVALLVGLSTSSFGRDDGRYANDPLKFWFDNLTSSNGKCCSFADGFSVSDVDWDAEDGHYRVLLHGQWVNVPNSSVVTEPNRYGPAVVWPYMDRNGNNYIRYFLPGAASRRRLLWRGPGRASAIMMPGCRLPADRMPVHFSKRLAWRAAWLFRRR